jgi:hypothetical protein
MHEYLSNAIKTRLYETKSSSNPRYITDKLKEILNILSQTGEYEDFDTQDLQILKLLLNSSNLTIVEYSIRVLAGLNPSYLLKNAEILKNHEDWLIRLLIFQVIFYFTDIDDESLLNHIFDKEDQRIRWHVMNYLSNFETAKRERIDVYFSEKLNEKKNSINQILARFYFSLINPSVYLKKLLNFIKEFNLQTQEEIDIIEIIALNLAKTKSADAFQTLIELYKIYRDIEFASKHYGFFIDGYIELLLQYPTEGILIFQEFSADHQREIAKSLIKYNLQEIIFDQILQLKDLDEDVKNTIIHRKKTEEKEINDCKDTLKMDILL